MGTARLRISDAATIRVQYEDNSAFGSAVDEEIDRRIRVRCGDIVAARRTHGMAGLVARSDEFLEAAFAPGVLGDLYCGPGRLREDFLYPSAALTNPAALVVDREGRSVAIPLAREVMGDLARWMGEWSAGGAPPSAGPARSLWLALEDAGALDGVPAGPPLKTADVTFVGHATIAHRAGSSLILIDPFLRPRSKSYPAEYQPIGAAELGPVDAIFITHSHPDHFDPGSLLRFGADVPIYVPAVERELILTVDIAHRLAQFGFSQVRSLPWFEEARIGPLRVVALPFYGEQPTCGPRLHQEVRCIGNTYVVETAAHRVAYLADSGVDAAGDVKQVAAEARAKLGPIDVLFGTHRGFPVYPIQYLFSSVAQYLLFVPPGERGRRQQIMNDAHDLLDTAETWGARLVVPYACGGAPWYWDLGMGPGQPSPGMRFRMTDPPPEELIEAQRARSETAEGFIPSPVEARVLRPGEGLVIAPTPQTVRFPEHTWPYGSYGSPSVPDRDPTLLLRGGEDIEVVRKKVLLQILALAEAERRAIGVSAAELQTMADTFRRRYGLVSPLDMEAWMKAEGLDKRGFAETMRDFVVVDKLCEAFAARIDEVLDVSLRINTARDFLARKGRAS